MNSGFALRVASTCWIAGTAALAASFAPAAAATFTDLHAFCSKTGCADGNYPTAPLVSDAAGDLFGTTALGGSASEGTIFELIPNGQGGYKFKRLHSFCAKTNCTDGNDPVAGLVIDSSGNLYGTTEYGGALNGGTAFELIRSGTTKKFKVLHSFCAQGAACADGSAPFYDGLIYKGAAAGKPYDGSSPLYGTTLYGGENNAGYAGTVYELKPGAGKKWKEKVIYQFCAQTNCADGMEPRNGMVMDASGNLYGVTYGGGNGTGDGTIFRLSRSNGVWSEAVLYDFCSETSCADGTNPASPPALDAAGDLVGTASGGGAKQWGVVYSFAPKGGSGQYNVLYNFCSQANCDDGAGPMGRIALDAAGDIFGTAIAGGTQDFGTAWELSGGSTFNLLYTFCSIGNCSDGLHPVGGVMLDSSQNVIGTISEGGPYSDGMVFKLTP